MSINDMRGHQNFTELDIQLMAKELSDSDKAIFYMAEIEWYCGTGADVFTLMIIREFCAEVVKIIEHKYPRKGGSWKRRMIKVFNEFAISFGMRLTKARMERARYG